MFIFNGYCRLTRESQVAHSKFVCTLDVSLSLFTCAGDKPYTPVHLNRIFHVIFLQLLFLQFSGLLRDIFPRCPDLRVATALRIVCSFAACVNTTSKVRAHWIQNKRIYYMFHIVQSQCYKINILKGRTNQRGRSKFAIEHRDSTRKVTDLERYHQNKEHFYKFFFPFNACSDSCARSSWVEWSSWLNHAFGFCGHYSNYIFFVFQCSYDAYVGITLNYELRQNENQNQVGLVSSAIKSGPIWETIHYSFESLEF